MDLVSGRHTGINAWFNNGARRGGKPPAVNTPFDSLYFTPQGLRNYGVR